MVSEPAFLITAGYSCLMYLGSPSGQRLAGVGLTANVFFAWPASTDVAASIRLGMPHFSPTCAPPLSPTEKAPTMAKACLHARLVAIRCWVALVFESNVVSFSLRPFTPP